MKFFAVLDATGHPAVMGEDKLHHSERMFDVVGEYPSYEAAMDAVKDMRSSRDVLSTA
jgi:hypothetical protein